MTWTHASEALTFGAKLQWPVLRLFQRTMWKLMREDLDDLAAFLERET